MSKHFITFGAGHKNYLYAGQRLTQQAKNTKLFDSVGMYSLSHLQQDKLFWNKHHSFISKNPRGFGFWLWKSYIIKKKMDQMKDGDILLYLDVGCEIDVSKKSSLEKCFTIVVEDKIIGTMCGKETDGHLEKHWTKKDLFLKLQMNESTYSDTVQRQGGTNMFYVCDETRKLVNEWYDISCIYHLLDDSRSVNPNYPGFREHRHDQSIFSLLTKKHGLFSKTSLYNCGVLVERNISGLSNIGKEKKEKRSNKIKMIIL